MQTTYLFQYICIILNKPMFKGIGHGFQPAVDIQLVKDILNVVTRC